MEKYYLENLPQKIKNAVITIGNFDGVHKGHQNIFKTIKEKAKKINGKSVVITFDPHPLKILGGEQKIFLLTPLKKKLILIEKFGIDYTILIKFTKEFAQIEPVNFVKTILYEKIGAKEIFVGYNYFFGKNKTGDINLLKKLGKQFNINVNIIEPYIIDGKVVSSSLCRELISKGKIKEVSKFLGRYYLIEGTVVKGKGLGKKVGIPTANIKSENEIYPKDGVYAVKVAYSGKIFDGVCSIGFNPTFDSRSLSVEIHIFDFNEEIYQKTLKVVFIDRIRNMIKFKDVNSLITQIKNDIKIAKKLLKPVKISLKFPHFF